MPVEAMVLPEPGRSTPMSRSCPLLVARRVAQRLRRTAGGTPGVRRPVGGAGGARARCSTPPSRRSAPDAPVAAMSARRSALVRFWLGGVPKSDMALSGALTRSTSLPASGGRFRSRAARARPRLRLYSIHDVARSVEPVADRSPRAQAEMVGCRLSMLGRATGDRGRPALSCAPPGQRTAAPCDAPRRVASDPGCPVPAADARARYAIAR